ncbi:MAG TPA: TonB family protein, partial [Myxococcota bacterium]
MVRRSRSRWQMLALAAAVSSSALSSSAYAFTEPKLLGTPPAIVHPLDDVAARALGDVNVALLLTIDAAGAVSAVDITSSSGNDVVDAAAVAYAKALRFNPARSDAGEPTPVRVPLTLGYTAPAVVEPPPAPPPPAVVVEPPPPPAHRHDEDERHDHDVDGNGEPVGVMRVRHRRASAPPTSTSDLHIVPGALKGVPRRTAGEMLSFAPGVLLQNHGGDGHPEGIFLRGFDAGEGQDLELSLEGVPLNAVSAAHGHGFADTNIIVPLLVEELRIVEGPFDPRQGDFAVAGSADYTLGRSRPGLLARVGYGQFNTLRAEAAYSPKDAPDLFVGGKASMADNSWGPARASSSAALNAGGTVHVNDGLDVRVLGAASSARYDNAGVVRLDDLAAKRLPCGTSDDEQFFCSYDQNQGGSLQRGLLSATAMLHLGEVHLDQQVFGLYGRSRTVENFTGFVSDPVELGGSQRGDAVEYNDERLTFGTRARARRRFELFGTLNDIEAGVYARHDDATVLGSRLRASDRAPYKSVFDHDVDVTNLAAWASVRLVPLPWLSVSGGARVDSYFFAVEDRTRPATDRAGTRLTRQGAEANGAVFQPRASVAWRL